MRVHGASAEYYTECQPAVRSVCSCLRTTHSAWYAVAMFRTRRFAAVSFDVGFTLIDSVEDAPEIVTALLAERNIVPDGALLAQAHHRAEQLFLEDYFRPLSDTWEADERILRLYHRYYVQLLDDLGVVASADDAQTIIDRYLAPTNWRVYPAVLNTLALLKQQGYHLGIASDWGSGLPRILHTLGLSRYLDWAVVSGVMGFAKPSPQFYQLVVQRAGVTSSDIVHVGDSYYADVRGAHGWHGSADDRLAPPNLATAGRAADPRPGGPAPTARCDGAYTRVAAQVNLHSLIVC